MSAERGATKLGHGEAAVPLWRNVSFQLLWAGSAFTFLGREITDLVYPLVILFITRSPASAGLFAAVQIVSALVFGLPAGELAARFDRRRLLLVAEGIRALATGVVVAALIGHVLTLPLLLVVAAMIGASQPLSGSARILLVRTVVPSEQLTLAMTQEEVRSYGASLAGPPLGGLLYAMGRAMPLAVTAACYVISFACALFIRPRVGVPDRSAGGSGGLKEPVLAGMLGGLSVIWTAPTLRRVLLFTAAMNMVSAPLLLIAVVQLEQRGTPSAVIGLVTAGLAVGGLAGAALIRPLHRLPPGVLMLGVASVTAGLITLISMPWGPWWLAAILFLLTLWVPAMRVLVDIVIFRQVPDHQRGRAIAGAMTIYGVGSALGLLAAGQLLEHQSIRSSVLIIAGALAVIAIIGVTNRSMRRTTWPSDQEPVRGPDIEQSATPPRPQAAIAAADLAEVDFTDPRTYATQDLSAVWRHLRRTEPVRWQPGTDGRPGFWMLTRYEDVVWGAQQDALLSSERGNVLDMLLSDGDSAAGSMLPVSDGPAHRALRKLITRAFTPRALAGVLEQVRETAARLVADAAERGEVDFGREVAARLPLATICDLLAVPDSDREHLCSLTGYALGSDSYPPQAGRARVARNEILLYFAELADTRRDTPHSDVVSLLATGELGDRLLTDADVMFNCYSLVLGGEETTRLSIAGGVQALARHPEQWRAYRAGEISTDTAVDEVLRWTSATTHLGRAATADITRHGMDIRAGDIVTLWTCSANRDEDVFPDPDRFDLARTPNKHVTFGHGHHFCVGAYLARMEVGALLESLRDYVTEIVENGPPQYIYSNFLAGVTSLPLILKK